MLPESGALVRATVVTMSAIVWCVMLSACPGTSGNASLSATLPRPAVPVTVKADAGAPNTGADPENANDPRCEAEMFSETPGSGLTKFEDLSSSRYGFKDASGHVVVPARYLAAYEFNAHGVAAVIEPGPAPKYVRLAFIDVSGRVIADAFEYDNGPDYFVDGRARIVGNGKVGFIDAHGAIVIAPTFDFATPFCGDRAVVCSGCTRGRGDEHDVWSGGRWGVIDHAGRFVIPLGADSIESDARGQRFTLRRGGRETVVDRDGRPVRSGLGGIGASPSAPKPVSIPAEWARCRTDADCTYVSLGCCDTTPVARAHAPEAQQMLAASGRPFCPPKAACGPSVDGTWSGAPGKCSRGVCAEPD